jgi:hypothetical protein
MLFFKRRKGSVPFQNCLLEAGKTVLFRRNAMSSGNVYETLFKQWASIGKLVLDNKRDPEEVSSILQAIIAGKRLVEAKPTLQEMLVDWTNFYKEVFGLDLDFSGIPIPDRKPGFDRLLVVAKGMTPQHLFDRCAELFPSWKYADKNLDEVIKSDRTSQNGHYAVWVRDRVEADEENRKLSANDLKVRGGDEITAEERMLYELKFFKETGQHLDKTNWTFCAGSRDSYGNVPYACWCSDGFGVYWSCASHCSDGLRSRSVVS